jgi:hypothetical protein
LEDKDTKLSLLVFQFKSGKYRYPNSHFLQKLNQFQEIITDYQKCTCSKRPDDEFCALLPFKKQVKKEYHQRDQKRYCCRKQLYTFSYMTMNQFKKGALKATSWALYSKICFPVTG